jgi:NitT/TauT family transport system permease protein
LIAAARSLGAGRWSVFREVILPGAAPSIVTGLSIGMGTSWFCLVTAEMIAGQYGIGYYTWESYNLQRYPDIVVGMLSIGLFGMASSALVTWTGHLLMPWYRRGSRQGA